MSLRTDITGKPKRMGDLEVSILRVETSVTIRRVVLDTSITRGMVQLNAWRISF